MKSTLALLTCLVILTAVTGCAPSQKSYTLEETQTNHRQHGRSGTGTAVHRKPIARQEVADAAGYGVFSNANVMALFVEGGGGTAFVVDNKTGRKNYMKVGLGGVASELAPRTTAKC